jgi:uncharacterized protein
MFVNISSLKPDQKQDYKGDLSQVWLKEALSEADIKTKELSFDLIFEKKGDFIEVDGHIDAVLELECVKCLELFDYPVKNKFRVFFYQEEDSSLKDRELTEEDLEFSLIHGDKIEIAEILREQLLLSLPDYPRCNALCQGIST